MEKRIRVENMEKAIERAKRLEDYKNPSSLVYRLIEAMESGNCLGGECKNTIIVFVFNI